MKFDIISDLHLEFNEISEIDKLIIESKDDKCLILAGDIINYESIDKLKIIIDKFKEKYIKIFYVLGNHEFYNHKYFNNKCMDKIINDYINICIELDIILLNNNYYEIDDILIYGTTLWSNMDLQGILQTSDKYFLDSSEIKRGHVTSVKLLEEFLIKNISKNKIVVSHYLPSFKFIHEKYKKENDDNEKGMNSCFATNLEFLFQHFKQDTNNYWIFGHTHSKIITNYMNIHFICNPFGYPDENIEIKELYSIEL